MTGRSTASTTGQTITIDPPTFINNGTIEAVNGATLSVAYGAAGGNTGTVDATTGANLTLTGGNGSSTFTGFGSTSISGGGILSINVGNNNYWANLGTISVTGSTVYLGGSFTQSGLTASGGTFSYDGSSTIDIAGTLNGGLTLNAATGSWHLGVANNGSYTGTLLGGTFTASGGATLYAGFYGALNGVTLDSAIDLATYNNTVTVTNGLTLNNVMLLLGNQTNTSTAGQINFSGGNETVGGNGTITFGFYSANDLFTGSSSTVTLGNGVTIDGKNGQIYGNAAVINNGTIEANTSGDTITISSALPSFTNNGTVEAVNSGTVVVSPTTLTNFSSGTLTGGTWEVLAGTATGSTLYGFSSAITTDAATILVDGSGSNFYTGTSGTNNALGSLTSITSTGAFTIQNGAVYSASAVLNDAGALTVQSGSTLVDMSGLTVSSSGTFSGAGGAVLNEEQLVVVTGSSGTFMLVFNGFGTSSLPLGAGAGQVQSALNSLSSIGGVGGSVSVTGEIQAHLHT